MNVFWENKLKKAFIKNNPFADYGINASVQHNKLYAKATTKAQKAKIREYWRLQLDEIARRSERDGLSVAQWELLLFSGNESE